VRLTGLTLKEIGLQRINSYRPDLVIENIQFYAYTNPESNFPIEFTHTRRSRKSNEEVFFTFISLNLKCFNLGFGAAKNLNVHFDFEPRLLIEAIHLFHRDKPFENMQMFEITTDDNGIGFHLLDGTTIMTDIYKPDHYSIVLPVSYSKRWTDIMLPGYISLLYAIYCYLKWISIHNIQKLPNFPPIRANLSFYDINNNLHKKDFEINLKWLGGRQDEIWNEISVTG